MATSRGTVTLLVAGMLITGCSNSLWSKFQDLQCVENCDDADPSKRREFSQPVWQTINMFVGESLCLLVLHLLKSRLNPWRGDKGGKGGDEADVDGSARIPAPLPKSKYKALSQSEPNDSGIVVDDERYIQHPIRRGLAATLVPSRVAPDEEVVPFGGHGATPTPVATALDDEVEEDAEETLTGYKAVYMWLPAACDIIGTSLMNIGLLFTPVSVFQMVRGALPIWVGLFSILFLGRRLPASKWLSLIIIMLGVAVVGLAGAIGHKAKPIEAQSVEGDAAGTVVVGVTLIFFAQLFTASQFVTEEKIMARYSVPPLRAVGLEGVFGLFTTLVALGILHAVIGTTPKGQGGFFDARTGWSQIVSHPAIAWSCLAIAFSIACFNFFGLAITRTVSATARSVIDTCRSLGIWAFSLCVGWEHFSWLQLLGFALLVFGSFLFNDIVTYPDWIVRCCGENPAEDDDECVRVVRVDDDFDGPRIAGASGTTRSAAVRRRSGTREGRPSHEETPLLSEPSA